MDFPSEQATGQLSFGLKVQQRLNMMKKIYYLVMDTGDYIISFTLYQFLMIN